jgi:outer membrane protein assembly factor BamB
VPGTDFKPGQKPPPGGPARLTGKLMKSAVTAPEMPGSWPRFRGPNRDNISPETLPLVQHWTAAGPRLLWAVTLGEGYAGPAVQNGRVYVLDYDQKQDRDTLRCIALADGQEVWNRSYPVKIKSNHGMSRTVPALTPKYAVTLGPKCQVVCVDPITGNFHWGIDLVNEYHTVVPPWYAGQCPLIDGNRVIIAPGGLSLMIAVDLATGQVLWKTPNPNMWGMTHSSITPLTFHGQKMYIYCASGGVVGVSATDGHILWQTDQWKVNIANVPTPIVVGDGRIFFTGGYDAGSLMLQLAEESGHIVPQVQFRVPANVFSSNQQTPILYQGYLYGVIPDGELACMDLNGHVRWASGSTRFGLGPYLIADGKIFVMNDVGLLTVAKASPDAYAQLAQSRVLNGPDAWGPMAIVDGRLIARDLTHMVCLDVR